MELAQEDRVSEALEALEPLLEKSDARAHTLAGAGFELSGSGVKVDFEKARYCYEFAVNAEGCVVAALGLARIFYFGKGFDVDIEYSHSLYSIISEGVDEPLADIGLARIHLDDRWKNGDIDLANRLLNRAMSRGYVGAYVVAARFRKRQGRFFDWLKLSLQARLKATSYLVRDIHDIRLWTDG